MGGLRNDSVPFAYLTEVSTRVDDEDEDKGDVGESVTPDCAPAEDVVYRRVGVGVVVVAPGDEL